MKVMRYIPSYPREFGPWDIAAADDITDAIKSVDAARAQLQQAEANLRQLVSGQDTTRRARAAFQDFLAHGGITAGHFRAYLKGKFTGSPVKRRQHLRLVASVEVAPLKPVKQTTYEGPDTAA